MAWHQEPPKKIIFRALRHTACHRCSPQKAVILSKATTIHIYTPTPIASVLLSLPRTPRLETRMAPFLDNMIDSAGIAGTKDCATSRAWTTVIPTDFGTYLPQPTTTLTFSQPTPVITTFIVGTEQPIGTSDAASSHPGSKAMPPGFPFPLPLASHQPSAHAEPNTAGTLTVSVSAPAALDTNFPPATLPVAGANNLGAGASPLGAVPVVLLIMSLLM